MKALRNQLSLFKFISVVTLLGIYISALLFNYLHSYFHHDHHSQEICTAASEKDPCHIKAFHHNQADGCKHETHVYTLKNKCELCDAILAKYYFPEDSKSIQKGIEIFQYSTFIVENFVPKFSNESISLRGPPSSLFYKA